MIVDDDEGIRILLERSFAAAGYTVCVAGDGAEAMRRVEEGCDLVVTDILMPGEDGVQLLLQLRKLTNPPKVIAISGGGMLGSGKHLELAGQLGASATLRKPFSPTEIILLVRQVLDAVD